MNQVLALSLVTCAAAFGAPLAEPDFRTELVGIPGGIFLMGSESGDRDERPVRKTSVDSFLISRTEVTLGWYLRCMADETCSPPVWWSLGYYEESAKVSDNASRMGLPVTGVSWRQAVEFCRWLGPDFALPTEAQWEYAAGGAKGWTYPWGNDPAKNPGAARKQELRPVSLGQTALFGLGGMGGSVWEWTMDCYDEAVPDSLCKRRVAKGGSWSEHLWNLRVANKSFGLIDQGYKGLGFRVVRNAK